VTVTPREKQRGRENTQRSFLYGIHNYRLLDRGVARLNFKRRQLLATWRCRPKLLCCACCIRRVRFVHIEKRADSLRPTQLDLIPVRKIWYILQGTMPAKIILLSQSFLNADHHYSSQVIQPSHTLCSPESLERYSSWIPQIFSSSNIYLTYWRIGDCSNRCEALLEFTVL